MKVSFILPSFNCAGYLPLAVESVLKQTHKDVECIIVNDGSTDTIKLYLDWLKDERVKVIHNEKSLGRSVARNQGNALATGDILCVLDADDLAIPRRAEWMVEAFKSGAEFVYGSAITMDAIGKGLGEIRANPFSLEKALTEKVNRIVHSTVAYTKKLAMNYPYKDGEIAELGIDDWAQQIMIACAGHKLTMEPKVVSAYRILETSISKTRDEEAVSKFKDAYLSALKVSV